MTLSYAGVAAQLTHPSSVLVISFLGRCSGYRTLPYALPQSLGFSSLGVGFSSLGAYVCSLLRRKDDVMSTDEEVAAISAAGIT
jgi:hypothetical protein